MKKVIPFPKEKSKKAWAMHKRDGQRLFLSMSLFSLILVAIFSSEQMMRLERPIYIVTNTQGPAGLQDLNRAIASAQPVNVFRDLEWEHKLAKRLGADKAAPERAPASLSEKLTLMDDLRYGPLAGKYRIQASQTAENPRVSEIEYIDSSEVNDQPIHLGDTAGFLMKYRSLMNVDYSRTDLAYQADGREVYQLFDQDERLVGRANVKVDSEGKFLGLSLERQGDRQPSADQSN